MINYSSIYFKLRFVIWNLISRFLIFNADKQVVGDCNRCGKCCQISGCPYLDFIENKYSCRIYSHPLRKILNCASYPKNKKAIELAECISYTVIKIPIKDIGQPIIVKKNLS